MYGKFFSSTFTGSMFGAGPVVFAVWGYVIANANDSTVEINPPMLAAVIGASVGDVEEAIAKLLAPDPRSRNPENDGRRLVHEGGFQYRVTSHEKYRAIRNEEDRRAYNRDAQKRHREKVAKAKASNGQSMSQGHLSAPSAHTEAETETETETETDPDLCVSSPDPKSSSGSGAAGGVPTMVPSSGGLTPFRAPARPYPVGAATMAFLAVFDAYPRKDAKLKAAAVFQELAAGYEGGEAALSRAILDAFGRGMLKREPYRGPNGKRPFLETVLAERRWEDPASAPDDASGNGRASRTDAVFEKFEREGGGKT